MRLDVDQGLSDKENCSTVGFLSDSGGIQVSSMKTLRGFVLALDDHQCSNVVDKLVKARCLHVPPPGGWRVVGGAHGPGVVQGLAQHVEPGGEHVERSTEGGRHEDDKDTSQLLSIPAIIVQHEVFEDDWSNGQLSLAGSHLFKDKLG